MPRHPMPEPPLPSGRGTAAVRLVAALAGMLVTAAILPTAAPAADLEDDFETGRPRWSLGAADSSPRLGTHALAPDAAHRGFGGERIRLEAAAGTTLRFELPIGNAAVIDELRADLWVRANRPAIRLAMRVTLPGFLSPATGRPLEVLVPGSASRHADHWERLEVTDVGRGLERQLSALRAEHGPRGDLTGATATHLVLDLYSSPGHYDIAIDDLHVESAITAPLATAAGDGTTAVRPVGYDDPLPATRPAPSPPAALTRGILEVGGLPFFPRSIDHNGEPLEALARLGFNCVRLASPATADLLAEAEQADVWLICPPPELPDVDIRDLDSLPAFSPRWDRVLFWDLGQGLAEADAAALAERVRRTRTCDARCGRPVIAAADSGLRVISRPIDMLVARRTVLGTSLELLDYLSWLRERPRLTRPGTPLLAALSTELDPRTAFQAASLSGIGGQGLAVDAESLCLASLAALSAGTRGILYGSTRRIDGDDHESRARAAAALATNLNLKVLEPWGAAGRFAAAAQSSDPEVQAVVLEAARARMLLAWRCVQGSQIVARHYHGDIPRNAQPLTILVPGVPEAHQAWEVSPGGLRPLRHKRVTGGISLTLDSFHAHTLVLLSGDPAVTAHVQERVRELVPLALSSARTLARQALADDAALLSRLPAAALGNLPVGAMIGEAQRSADAAEAAVSDPATAIAGLLRSAAIAGQIQRLAWERGVLATGSMVASPLSTSDATLAEHWRFIEALGSTMPAAELLAGGDMERIDNLGSAGWRHFALTQETLQTTVDIDRTQPATGTGCLSLRAEPTTAAEAPVVVETPPVWVTTPAVRAPAGKLLEIQARVWVPKPIRGSVDGLLVFDSLGGPALAERVGVTPSWRRLVLYRIVPDTAADEPLTVTFALTGMGEARIDDVSIRVLERAGGTPVNVVSTTPAGPGPTVGPAVGFPRPVDVLAAPTPLPDPTPPPAAAAVEPPVSAAPAWPGMNLEWPKLLPFGQPSNAPPPGPGGGTIDPFKRARGG